MNPESQAYYDAFATGYDAARGRPYHRLIDQLELEILAPLVAGRTVLEVGAGTGLVLLGLQHRARRVVGLDLSRSMLLHARRRGLPVVQASAFALPVPDGAVDVACCFKVFAHLPEPREALLELQRVVRPGGHVVVELYNPWSWRGLLRRYGPARHTSSAFHEQQVHTRYDTAQELQAMLPPGLQVEYHRGIRILTPAGRILSIPLLGAGLARAERWLSRTPGFWRLAGFLVVILKRTDS